jgi:hypothetical protein
MWMKGGLIAVAACVANFFYSTSFFASTNPTVFLSTKKGKAERATEGRGLNKF